MLFVLHASHVSGGLFLSVSSYFGGGVRILQSTPLTACVSGVLCVYLHALFNITLILYICSLNNIYCVR